MNRNSKLFRIANKMTSISCITSAAVVVILAIVLTVVPSTECASRQEQEILLLDALSRKYSQGSSNQFEPNSVMDMLGRSTNILFCWISLLPDSLSLPIELELILTNLCTF